MGLCESNCKRSRGGRCSDADSKGPCNACYAHTCNDKCRAKCKEPVDTDAGAPACDTTCSDACTGSCTARANAECQVDCQAEVYTVCEEEQVETCETDCETTGGAIFCDGKFLIASDIKACAAELSAKVDIQVDVSIDGDVDVGNKSPDKEEADSVEDKLSNACAVRARGSSRGGSELSSFGLFLVGLVFARRRALG
jgi:hypothetical protein